MQVSSIKPFEYKKFPFMSAFRLSFFYKTASKNTSLSFEYVKSRVCVAFILKRDIKVSFSLKEIWKTRKNVTFPKVSSDLPILFQKVSKHSDGERKIGTELTR